MVILRKVIFFTVLGVFGSCSDEVSENGFYEIPVAEPDGISVGSARDLGLDVNLLSEMVRLNLDGTYENMHSILIAKDNQLVFEQYFRGKPIYGQTTDWDKSRRHNLHSVTKSFNSALVGIAIDKFELSLDDKIQTFFPEIHSSNWEGQKGEITVEDLLTMSSGLKWDEWSYPYDDDRNDHTAMYESSNWVHFVLEQPLASSPGTQFVYNSGLSITLGEIVSRVSGMELGTFASEHLFQPLGTTNVGWHTSPNRIFQTGGGLSLRPRDMLKFGLMFLHNGEWESEQIISRQWVENSTKQQGPNPDYGYQWWMTSYRTTSKKYNAYSAAGRGGQFIVVITKLNLVVVFTAGNDNALSVSQPREMMIKYILPSIEM